MSTPRRCNTPGRGRACKRKVSGMAHRPAVIFPTPASQHARVRRALDAAAAHAAGPRTRGMPGSGVEQRPSASSGGASPSAPAGRMMSGPPWLCTLTRNALRTQARVRQQLKESTRRRERRKGNARDRVGQVFLGAVGVMRGARLRVEDAGQLVFLAQLAQRDAVRKRDHVVHRAVDDKQRAAQVAQRGSIVPALEDEVRQRAHQRGGGVAHARVRRLQNQAAHAPAARLHRRRQARGGAGAHRGAEEHDALRAHAQAHREVVVRGAHVAVDGVRAGRPRRQAVAGVLHAHQQRTPARRLAARGASKSSARGVRVQSRSERTTRAAPATHCFRFTYTSPMSHALPWQ